jgi:hypothetical protein
MLETCIIYQIDKSKWEIPMVLQPKKHDLETLRNNVDFRALNKVTITNSFPTMLVDEIVNEVVGHECYSVSNGFLGYNQVPITK